MGLWCFDLNLVVEVFAFVALAWKLDYFIDFLKMEFFSCFGIQCRSD